MPFTSRAKQLLELLPLDVVVGGDHPFEVVVAGTWSRSGRSGRRESRHRRARHRRSRTGTSKQSAATGREAGSRAGARRNRHAPWEVAGSRCSAKSFACSASWVVACRRPRRAACGSHSFAPRRARGADRPSVSSSPEPTVHRRRDPSRRPSTSALRAESRRSKTRPSQRRKRAADGEQDEKCRYERHEPTNPRSASDDYDWGGLRRPRRSR